MKKLYSYAFLILALGSVLLPKNSDAQIMTFNTRTLISGVDNSVGATYRFSSVKPGIDAIVSIDSVLNGAVIKDIDKSGWGYVEAFQPFIQPPNSVTTSAYAVFTMKFVTTATLVPVTIPLFSMTALDIDGSNNIKEFDVIDMGGGTASYSSSPTEISISASWSAFRAINIAGIGHGGPDTTEKVDIFTVTKPMVSQLTLKCGTVGTTSSNSTREYSFFPASVSYPALIFTLPLNLLSFTATLNKENNSADIKWTTANEYNVSHFVVEKSSDGKTFSDAATVFAGGSTSGDMNYAFSDNNINATQAHIIYYRLRAVDNDGKLQYSPVRMIVIGQSTSAVAITAFPNPVADELRITLPEEWQGQSVLFEVFSQNGQKVKGKSVSSSSQTETLNLGDVSRGIYIVRASFGSAVSIAKVIKN